MENSGNYISAHTQTSICINWHIHTTEYFVAVKKIFFEEDLHELVVPIVYCKAYTHTHTATFHVREKRGRIPTYSFILFFKKDE